MSDCNYTMIIVDGFGLRVNNECYRNSKNEIEIMMADICACDLQTWIDV